MKLMQVIALEENQSKENKESEVVIYAKIGSFQDLDKASKKIEQHQLESTFSNGQKCRVRMNKDDNESYEFTYKLKLDTDADISINKEFTVQVDKDFFDNFKFVANKQVIKDRYIFNSENVELTYNEGDEKKVITIPNIIYEVDVYKKEDGSFSEWCKIDIEVDNILNFLDKEHPQLKDVNLNVKISHLPFRPENPIMSTTKDSQQKEFLGSLWDNEFNRKIIQ